MTEDSDLRARVVALENWRVARDIESARHDEKWSNMEKRLSGIEEDISGVQETLTWIMRLVIGGIIAGIIAFMLKGGFAL